MSEQSPYRDPGDERPASRYDQQQTYEPPWAQQRTPESTRKVRLDRPFYTGMVFGFGLMVATLVASVVFAIVFGILGAVFGSLLVGI